MAYDTINVGAFANDPSADKLRTAFGKVNTLIDFINAAGLGAGAFALKPTVKAATTGNITLASAQTIDGVSCVAGDRVLVKAQTTAAQNGIYVVAAGAWTRALDSDTWNEIHGSIVIVEQGTAGHDTAWMCTSDAGGTLETTAITFAIATTSAVSATTWGYLAATTSFMGPTLASANLAGLVTNLGGASAVRSALGLGGLAVLSSVGTTEIADAAVTDAKLRNSAALSVIGNASNGSAAPADIAAGSEGMCCGAPVQLSASARSPAPHLVTTLS